MSNVVEGVEPIIEAIASLKVELAKAEFVSSMNTIASAVHLTIKSEKKEKLIRMAISSLETLIKAPPETPPGEGWHEWAEKSPYSHKLVEVWRQEWGVGRTAIDPYKLNPHVNAVGLWWRPVSDTTQVLL